MEDELKIVLKSEDALRLDMQDQQPLELLLGNPVTYTGTTNYNELGNKPSINGVTLVGNRSNTDLNLVKRTGDTMTGYLQLPRAQFQDGDYPRITFLDSSTSTVVGGIINHNAQRRILVRQVSSNGSEETFQFPSSSSATSSTYYDVLTTKSAVSVAQGGTGATSASDAAENLGVVKKSGDTMTGRLNVPNLIAYDSNWPFLGFATSADDATIGGVWEDAAARRVVLRQIHSSGHYEDYILPGNGASDTNATYDVLTSKGGTMTGTLNTPTTRIYDSSTPMLSFVSAATDSSALAAIYSQIASRNMVLRTRGTAGYVEDYMLPNNTATGTHKNYEIFNSKDGVLAYKDQTVSISLSANTWTEMTVTQQVAPTGYTPLTRTIADGSTTAIRGYLFLAPNNMGNTAHILLYSTQAVTGTFTLRTWFLKSSAAIEL